MRAEEIRICVVGLGYVGLPLLCLFARHYRVVGFDVSQERTRELNVGFDRTLEVESSVFRSAMERGMVCTSDREAIRDCNFYIVAVPTPVDENNAPDLRILREASRTVGGVLSAGDTVVYESTVYPGVTEDICVPILEEVSGLRYNEGFYVGYSPERVNPGDKVHTVDRVCKVTSGSTAAVADFVDSVYASVISGGTHRASSIRVAEASKVIENSQRDINIAFVNELAKIFNRMGIDTLEVLEAAGTKWNFLPFRPGLVGGHCIGVDPYYLAQCAQRYGYNPEIILAGRRMNDGMGEYVADRVMKLMLKKGIQVLHSRVLVLGFTFKENCPDVRNTKVADIVRSFQEYHVGVTVYDPWVDGAYAREEYGIEVVSRLPNDRFDAVVLAVAHRDFEGIDLSGVLASQSVVYDVKGVMREGAADGRL